MNSAPSMEFDLRNDAGTILILKAKMRKEKIEKKEKIKN